MNRSLPALQQNEESSAEQSSAMTLAGMLPIRKQKLDSSVQQLQWFKPEKLAKWRREAASKQLGANKSN